MTITRMFRALVPSAVVVALAGACADYPSMTPQSNVVPEPLMAVSSRQPTLFRNSRPYAEQLGTAIAVSSARSGEVTLSARALLNPDGTITLVVTTGDLESLHAPGVLEHVQVKLSDPNGNEKRTLNYHNFSGGRAEIQLPTGTRGSNIHVQANVSGITAAMQVVEVSTSVRLVPDLAVGSINAPDEVLVNTPVNVSATVMEKNGDYPARADCVLFEDGAEISRASAIWVNAGRSVTCAFMPRFVTTGTKQLSVSVMSITPGDWNLSNNSLFKWITVVDPRPRNEFNWQGMVNGRANIRGVERSEGFWEIPEFQMRSEWSYFKEYLGEGWRDANVDGRRPGALVGPLSSTFKDRIDNFQLNDGAFDPVGDERTTSEGDQFNPQFGTVHFKQHCSQLTRSVDVQAQQGMINAVVARLLVCSNVYTGAPGAETLSETFFQYSAYAGDVTYYANDYSLYVAPGYKDAYSFNANVAYSFGTPIAGSEYGFEITVIGADGASVTASGAIPLAMEDKVELIPWQCTEFSGGGYAERSCAETNLTYSKFGGRTIGRIETPTAMRR